MICVVATTQHVARRSNNVPTATQRSRVENRAAFTEAQRPPGLPPLPSALVDHVVALTLAEPPGETTHWTGRAMAAASGISLRSVQRIWAAHGLQPHRVRGFKLSQDPDLCRQAARWGRLCPPAGPQRCCRSMRSTNPVPDRTQPGLPINKGRAGTMTHDYLRNGTTTLFAALNVLDGTIIGQCMARHRHQEFIRFLNRIEERRSLHRAPGSPAAEASARAISRRCR